MFRFRAGYRVWCALVGKDKVPFVQLYGRSRWRLCCFRAVAGVAFVLIDGRSPWCAVLGQENVHGVYCN